CELVLLEAVPVGVRLHGGAAVADAVEGAARLVGQDFAVMVVQIGLMGRARYGLQPLAYAVIRIEAGPGAVGDQDICNRLLHNSLREKARYPSADALAARRPMPCRRSPARRNGKYGLRS